MEELDLEGMMPGLNQMPTTRRPQAIKTVRRCTNARCTGLKHINASGRECEANYQEWSGDALLRPLLRHAASGLESLKLHRLIDDQLTRGLGRVTPGLRALSLHGADRLAPGTLRRLLEGLGSLEELDLSGISHKRNHPRGGPTGVGVNAIGALPRSGGATRPAHSVFRGLHKLFEGKEDATLALKRVSFHESDGISPGDLMGILRRSPNCQVLHLPRDLNPHVSFWSSLALHCPQIVELNTNGAVIGPSDFDFLSRSGRLRKLKLSHCELGKGDYFLSRALLAGPESDLVLGERLRTGIGKFLVQCQRLEHLNLSQAVPGNFAEARFCAPSHDRTSLRYNYELVKYWFPTREGLAPRLQCLSYLRFLDITGLFLDAPSLLQIVRTCAQSLEHLRMNRQAYIDRAALFIRAHHNESDSLQSDDLVRLLTRCTLLRTWHCHGYGALLEKVPQPVRHGCSRLREVMVDDGVCWGGLFGPAVRVCTHLDCAGHARANPDLIF